nr:lysine 5,6-aminomutase subunit alpha [Bacteroidales bacterium]
MQTSKLGIDFKKVEYAKGLARNIAEEVQVFVDRYTTVAVERTICRLLGIDGVDTDGVPLPNIVVDSLKDKNILGEGVIFFIGNAVIEKKLTPQQIAEEISAGKLDLSTMGRHSADEALNALKPWIEASVNRIKERRQRRENYLNTIGEGPKPYIYV